MRWGDKHGGYGEHYWDLNHAGHGNNADDKYGSDSDDGSYRVHDHNEDEPYDEPSEQSPSYDNDEYDAEKSVQYDESNRAKRAHTQRKVKEEIIYGRKKEPVEEEPQEEHTKPVKVKRHRKRNHEVLPKENKDERSDVQEQQRQVSRKPDPDHYVPYEGGAGVRQHQQPEVTAASSAPRLFLEPSTGHVVDRATGQAYVLQPIRAY